MSRISKMSKSEALEYLIKVSKVQEKLLNKLVHVLETSVMLAFNDNLLFDVVVLSKK